MSSRFLLPSATFYIIVLVFSLPY